MSVSGLKLGIIALALAIALILERVLDFVGLVPFLIVALVVIVCIIAGLPLSALGLFRSWRRGTQIRMPVSALAANLIALAAIVVFASVPIVAFVARINEPTLEEAAQDLTEEGLTVLTIGGDRPALLVLPAVHNPQSPLPLVLNLHGYGSHSMAQNAYFGLSSLVDSHRFALIIPNGTRDREGRRAWNATEFCCGDSGSRRDDVAYLSGLVEDAGEHISIDRVYSVGLSNGGFMSYRLACESLPGLAAIVALGGTSFPDPARCASARPVSVLHIHGTDDEVVNFDGGTNPAIGEGSFAAARELNQRWAERAGCDLELAERLPSLDIDAGTDGDETSVIRYRSGCLDGLVVEFWEMKSSPHVPRLSDDFGQRILAWLYDTSG